MISYCVLCYRPKYDAMLIADLIAKTSVPYEILLWINTPDQDILKFISEVQVKGAPVRIVGSTPHNIGMNAFKHLFKASKHEMIVQLDDDVLRVSPGIAQKCMDIFSRRPEVKYLVADVWQDCYTNGSRPGMDSYKEYAISDGLYDGPIDSWYGVYHRSILPILMKAPYEKYFYLGSFVRGMLPRYSQIGLLCTKFKVLHASGPAYASAFGMLDFEVAKFRGVGSGMADGYARAKGKYPDLNLILAKFEEAKVAIDAFGVNAPHHVESKRAEWAKALRMVRAINDKYGLSEQHLEVLFRLVQDEKECPVVVEIGVCHGRTGALLAYVANSKKGEYHGIDNFSLDTSSKEAVGKTLAGFGVTATLHEGDSNGSSGKMLACPEWDKPIDVLFVDGGHDEANIKGDCEVWIPRVAPGGLAIFDDWNDGEPNSNAHWGIKHYSELHCKGWETIRTNDKLHIRRKPK